MRAGIRDSLITLCISSVIITFIYWSGIFIGNKLEKFIKWWDKKIKSENNKFHR